LHYDPENNILCQVKGSKYIRLYDFQESEKLYPHDSEMLFNTSQVIDIDNTDVSLFPKILEAKFLDCVLQEGESLYIPPKYWHYVQSLEVSFSVSFWWK
jgi:ribosomal protein L16 Arg81 hydroxylase